MRHYSIGTLYWLHFRKRCQQANMFYAILSVAIAVLIFMLGLLVAGIIFTDESITVPGLPPIAGNQTNSGGNGEALSPPDMPESVSQTEPKPHVSWIPDGITRAGYLGEIRVIPDNVLFGLGNHYSVSMESFVSAYNPGVSTCPDDVDAYSFGDGDGLGSGSGDGYGLPTEPLWKSTMRTTKWGFTGRYSDQIRSINMYTPGCIFIAQPSWPHDWKFYPDIAIVKGYVTLRTNGSLGFVLTYESHPLMLFGDMVKEAMNRGYCKPAEDINGNTLETSLSYICKFIPDSDPEVFVTGIDGSASKISANLIE